jgi:8-oxo-dGTP pyrophosphatase MutT (NUDIX family)
MPAELDAARLRRILGSSFPAPLLTPLFDRMRPAAVVVPIRLGPEPSVSFVLRSSHLSEHAGEVGFPGGKPEPGEELLDTACREAMEEVGLARADLDLLGTLTPVPVVTGLHVIHPFVMEVAPGARLAAASGEVERVLETPILAWLRGELRHSSYPTEWRGSRFLMPDFEIDGTLLYGATAIVFYELLTRVADALGIEMPAALVTESPPWVRRS